METDPNDRSILANWWPTTPNNSVNSGQWRLDVVTLLAVIGESSMTDHAQTITASVFCLLPRMLPAPQVLLKPSRPLRMPQTPAKVTGVFSGVALDTVGFFANIIHPLDSLEPFAFKVLQITHRLDRSSGDIAVPMTAAATARSLWRRMIGGGKRDGSPGGEPMMRIPGPPRETTETTLVSGEKGKEKEDKANGSASDGNASPGPNAHIQNKGKTDTRATGRSTVTFPGSTPTPAELEQGGLRRRPTAKQRIQDFAANPTLATTHKRPAIPAALWSPIHILGIFSMFLTLGLLAYAVYITDGPAIIAVSLISLQSSIVGYASWWHPLMMKRSHTNQVPRGDVMIRTREGAFIYIKCTEEVARELYLAGTEDCKYRVKSEYSYRLLMGIGTIMLMVSTVLLGNCSWNMQIFVGVSYISLNAMYWAMGMLPRHLFWDLSRYEWKWETPEDAQDAHESTPADDPKYDPREGVASFTRTLWYAIRETGLTGWVERSGASPPTDQWRQWLREAQDAAQRGQRNWPAVARKDDIFRTTMWQSAPAPTTDAKGASGVDGEGKDGNDRKSSTGAGGEGGGGGGDRTPAGPPAEGPVGPGSPDPAMQHAPLTEVQVQARTQQLVDTF